MSSRQAADADGWLTDRIVLLQVEGVTGDCDHPGYEGWINLNSISHQARCPVGTKKPPIHVRREAALRKKRAYIAGGLDQNGCPLPVPETEPKKAADGTVIPPTAAELEARPSQDDLFLQHEAALAEYDSHEDIDFRDEDACRGRPPQARQYLNSARDEVPHSMRGMRGGRPGMRGDRRGGGMQRRTQKNGLTFGTFRLSKFGDISSPQLMSLMMVQDEPVDVKVVFLQARPKKKVVPASTPAEDTAASSSSSAAVAPAEEDEEEEVPKDWIPVEEQTLFDCFLTSMSMNGGNCRPVESLTFEGVNFARRFINWHGRRTEPNKIDEATMEFDRHRRRATARTVAERPAFAVETTTDVPEVQEARPWPQSLIDPSFSLGFLSGRPALAVPGGRPSTLHTLLS